MKILHIITELNHSLPLEILQAHTKGVETHILLLHDAVLTPPDNLPQSAKLFAGARDVAARNISLPGGIRELSYEEIIDLLCTCDKAITW